MRSMNKSLLVSTLLPFIGFAQPDITITNQNTALIREKRVLELEQGKQRVRIPGIPAQIIPASVFIESDFEVLAQNFEHDLLNTDRVLKRFINSEILIEHPQGRTEGILLAFDDRSLIIKTADDFIQIISRNPEQKISLGMASGKNHSPDAGPALVWEVEASKKGKYPVSVSYLTNGLNWSADYTGILNDGDDEVIFSGWVSIENRSGMDFKETEIKLMSGDISVIRPERADFKMLESRAVQPGISLSPSFEQRPFYEYHLYDIKGKATLLNDQVRQIQLLQGTPAKIKKSYRLNSDAPEQVSVLMTMVNSRKNNLGIPLPEGVIRIYKKDGERSEFIGENRIGHTPADEKIEFETGKAFDIVSERKVLEIKRPTSRSERRTVSYSVKNIKDKQVEIEITESYPPYQEITVHTSDGEQLEKKAGSLKYLLKIAPGSRKDLNLDYTLNW